jgi:hypothetical protein
MSRFSPLNLLCGLGSKVALGPVPEIAGTLPEVSWLLFRGKDTRGPTSLSPGFQPEPAHSPTALHGRKIGHTTVFVSMSDNCAIGTRSLSPMQGDPRFFDPLPGFRFAPPGAGGYQPFQGEERHEKGMPFGWKAPPKFFLISRHSGQP